MQDVKEIKWRERVSQSPILVDSGHHANAPISASHSHTANINKVVSLMGLLTEGAACKNKDKIYR